MNRGSWMLVTLVTIGSWNARGWAADHPLTLDPAALMPTVSLDGSPAAAPAPQGAVTSTRYGWLDLLDHRSIYGHAWFPEPLIAEDGDVEHEIQLGYVHREVHRGQADEQWLAWAHGFGLLTVYAAEQYEWLRANYTFHLGRLHIDYHRSADGFGPTVLGYARHPLLSVGLIRRELGRHVCVCDACRHTLGRPDQQRHRSCSQRFESLENRRPPVATDRDLVRDILWPDLRRILNTRCTCNAWV